MRETLLLFVARGFLGLAPRTGYFGYRERLETCLQSRFADSEWQEMVDLGFAACAQRIISIPAFFAVNAEIPEDRERERRVVESFAQYVMKARSMQEL